MAQRRVSQYQARPASFLLLLGVFLIQIGDVVTLKSGGPKMTVEKIALKGDVLAGGPKDVHLMVADDTATCVYTINGRFTAKSFLVVMLAIVEEKVKG